MYGSILFLPLWLGVPLGPQDGGAAVAAEATQVDFETLAKEAEEAIKAHSKVVRAKMKEARDAGLEMPELDRFEAQRAFLPKFQAGAAAHAGSPEAAPFLVWIATYGGAADREASTAALREVVAHHAHSDGLGSLSGMFPYLGSMIEDEDAASAFLSKVEEGNPDATVRGWASFTRLTPTLERGQADAGFADAKAKLEGMLEGLDDKRLERSVRSKIAIAEKFAIGMKAPEIEGIDLDGVAFKLSDYDGKVVFLDFWGNW